jgi:hypothetical protein
MLKETSPALHTRRCRPDIEPLDAFSPKGDEPHECRRKIRRPRAGRRHSRQNGLAADTVSLSEWPYASGGLRDGGRLSGGRRGADANRIWCPWLMRHSDCAGAPRPAYDGEGVRSVGGRWNSKGSAGYPEDKVVERIADQDLPNGWATLVPSEQVSTESFGDAWIERQLSEVLSVPSVGPRQRAAPDFAVIQRAVIEYGPRDRHVPGLRSCLVALV